MIKVFGPLEVDELDWDDDDWVDEDWDDVVEEEDWDEDWVDDCEDGLVEDEEEDDDVDDELELVEDVPVPTSSYAATAATITTTITMIPRTAREMADRLLETRK